MELALGLLAIAATVLVGSWLADRVGAPPPLVLIVIGILGSYLPFVPEVAIGPDLVLLGILPPLLYATAIRTSLIDFKANKVAIIGLSVGLVLFTAAGVGLFVWWVIGVPFAVAFAIGAVVAPPDAVAATAVGRRIGLPRRLTSILEGESLVNDATALVSLRTALGAAGLSTGFATNITVGSATLDFAWASLGGVGIGLVVALVVETLRKRLASDPTFDTVLSFTVPFAAYLPAEEVHASGIISVVTAGLILGHRSPRSQPGASRLTERINWSSIQFLLENAVFLLIGLQAYYVIDRVGDSALPGVTIAVAAVGTLLLVLLLRPIWVFPFRFVAQRLGALPESTPWSYSVVLSWAGMRGVVTLAAALVLPLETPERDVLVLVAVVVTIGTLLIQGTTLPALARRLDVRGPDPREDALQAATVLQAATAAGLRRLDESTEVDDATREHLHEQARERINEMWERLGADATETPSDRYRRARMLMLDAERAEVLRLRDEGKADQEVLSVVLAALDLEETRLQRIGERVDEVNQKEMLPTAPVESPCEHLEEAAGSVEPHTPEGCEGCLRDGSDWVHLRLCLTCGHVGCCDSSPEKHATGHHEETNHPVMRSIEPGESWRWCFVDEVLG